MPLIVKIILLVFVGVAILVWFAERNPIHMDADKAARYYKWAMILIGLIMVAGLVKYCTGH